jgi:hypothetical protein
MEIKEKLGSEIIHGLATQSISSLSTRQNPPQSRWSSTAPVPCVKIDYPSTNILAHFQLVLLSTHAASLTISSHLHCFTASLGLDFHNDKPTIRRAAPRDSL